MSKKGPKTVKVRDLVTGENVTIPASELAPGMVAITIRGEEVWVHKEQLRVVKPRPEQPSPPEGGV